MLLASVIINVLLILERMFNKIKKSECCGSKLELITTNSPTKSNSEREINLSNINGDKQISINAPDGSNQV